MIVEVGKAMLEKLGYRVVVAKDGGKAIDMVHEAQGNLDLIILDLVMPGMDGGATFGIIRKKDPKMPVLFYPAVTRLTVQQGKSWEEVATVLSISHLNCLSPLGRLE